MPDAEYTTKEIADRGQRIYNATIHPKLDTHHKGHFVAIDIETSAYEIDASELEAIRKLKRHHPDAVAYLVRIGHPAAYRIGAALSSPNG